MKLLLKIYLIKDISFLFFLCNKVVFINDENFENAKDLAQAVKAAVEKQTGKPVESGVYYYVNGSVKSYVFSSDLKRVDMPARSRTCMIPTFITGDTLALRGVTSLHYSEDEILEGMYDFFMTDIRPFRSAMPDFTSAQST